MENMNIGSKLSALTFSFLFFTYSGVVCAASVSNEKPKTKLEAFQQQTGSVLIKGYSEDGHIVSTAPSTSIVQVRAMEFVSASTKKKAKGIIVEITEMSSRMNVTGSDRAFIDYDEVSDLLSGIDYISKATAAVTKHKQFEVKYTTKGDFSATTFNDEKGNIKAAIDVGRTSAHVPMNKFSEFRGFIVKAKKTLENLK